MSIDAAAKIGQSLTRSNKTISTAESCSGGLLGHRLTDIPGSSKYFKGGIIAYANEVKIKLLRVSPQLIKKHGAVSQPVAEAMAKNVRRIFNTDFAISITGIAGPSGGTKKKPVGLTHIAIAGPGGKILFQEFYLRGTRQQIKEQAVGSALKILLSIL